MAGIKTKSDKRLSRRKRIRGKVSGSAERPRLSVFRSNKHIFLQLINDDKGAVIVSASDLKRPPAGAKKNAKEGKVGAAREVGKELAELSKGKKIKTVLFDRGGYKYHGRVKAAAEGAREGGLKF